MVNDTLLDPDLTRALCILHYQTLGSLKLHYLHRSSPPRRRERGERGQHLSWPKLRTEVTFPSRSDWYSSISSPSHSSPFSLFFTPLLPLFCAGNLLDITTPQSALEHPGRSCPQGFLGRYQKHTGHSSLPASHTNGLCCVDVRIIDKCNLDVFYLFLGLFVMMSLNEFIIYLAKIKQLIKIESLKQT